MSHPTGRDAIVLEGVRVHNLQDLDLRVPLGSLVAVTGVSGSGKSSLAFDTLAVEGRRRYIETLSPTARGLLDRLDRPDADRIEGLPPTIAIRQGTGRAGARETVGTSAEIHDLLGLLLARRGQIICPDCQLPVSSVSPESITEWLETLPDGLRYQVAFEVSAFEPDPDQQRDRLAEEGFSRLAIADPSPQGRRTTSLTNSSEGVLTNAWVILDRLTTGADQCSRIEESLSQAFACGDGVALLLLPEAEYTGGHDTFHESDSSWSPSRQHEPVEIDGATWHVHPVATGTTCSQCLRAFTRPEPRLFSFHSPLGACPTCRGFGSIATMSLEKLVPDPSMSLRDGAIAAWTTPAYRHELDELLALAPDYGIPVDVPFRDLSPGHLELITHGVPERQFGGLDGFFDWLQRNRYKMSVRVFLNRWRSYTPCPACQGARLQPDALAVHLPVPPDIDFPSTSVNLGDLSACEVGTLADLVTGWQETDVLARAPDDGLAPSILDPLSNRLTCLQRVGLDYLTLDRPLRTLSSGESRRVQLTQALGSQLVSTLYVLDEPTAGLHAEDTQSLVSVLEALVTRGNSVVVVEHDPAVISAADHVIDIGPGAGHQGGEVVYEGSPEGISTSRASRTAAHIVPAASGDAGRTMASRPGRSASGAMSLSGVSHHNIQDLDISIPLGQLVVVAGVSGSGKSSLVEETLYPALCDALDLTAPEPRSGIGTWRALSGHESIEQVVMVDASPIGRSARSIPATYTKAFDEIRRLFASTAEARQRGYAAGQFSFNTAGGRCESCGGSGEIDVDMQFLADIRMTCPECGGRRFGRELLEVLHRGRSIADVLEMTVEEAFGYFRGEHAIRRRLQPLRDVGLDYLPLGQPTTTLSGGESQRLKLASHLTATGGRQTLFLLDEPTNGLHLDDIRTLLSCLESLLDVGHSVVMVEHHLDIIDAADHVIELGPGGGPRGGNVVASGTPVELMACDDSVTGRHLSCYNRRPR